MKVAFVFAGTSAANPVFQPYRSRRFTEALAAEGIAAVLVDVDIAQQSRFASTSHDAPGLTYYRNQVDRLPLILTQERPSAVLTFGATLDLAPVWREGAKAEVPILHFVSSEGSVSEPRPGADFLRTPPQRLARAWHTRHASRRVAGLVGSNRADLGRHLRQSYFTRARFSVVAPPPTSPPPAEAIPPATGSAEQPVFGFYDPEANESTLRFLLRALDLTGPLGRFALRIAPAALSRCVPERAGHATFVEATDPADFIRGIDVLLVPEAHDRTLPTIVTALLARRIVIVPDTGAAIELIDYGRHGVLHAAGSAYHFAMAVNVMTQSWSNRPITFEGIDTAVARTASEEVARAFARAFRKAAR
ncbi:MAG: hypothetical protein R3D62_04635 [Xanthobacteraceae bacterium]